MIIPKLVPVHTRNISAFSGYPAVCTLINHFNGNSARFFRHGTSSSNNESAPGAPQLLRMASIELGPQVAEDPNELTKQLSELQASATKQRVPWFQKMMPEIYFRQMSKEKRLQHLVSVAAIPDMAMVPEIVSNEYDASGNIQSVSIISSGKEDKGKIERQLKKLPDANRLAMFNVYNSKDDLLSITDVRYASLDPYNNAKRNGILNNVGENAKKLENRLAEMDFVLPENLKQYIKELQSGRYTQLAEQHMKNTGEILHANAGVCFDEKEVKDFLRLCKVSGMEIRMSPRRFCKVVQMYNTLLRKGTDEVLLDVESNYYGSKNDIMYTLALTNVLVEPVLSRIVKYIESRGLSIERLHLDRVQQVNASEVSLTNPSYNDVTFLRIVVSHSGHSTEKLNEVKTSLPLVAKWYDDDIMDQLYTAEKNKYLEEHFNFAPVDFEIATALLKCVHLIESRTDMYVYSLPNIYAVLARPQTFRIVELFKNRFDPNGTSPVKTEQGFNAKLDSIKDEIKKYIEVDVEKDVLEKMLQIVKSTERTNLYNPDRFALSLKLSGDVFMSSADTLRTEVPYGVFFVNGRRFKGLQLRFREIARGGLRLVTPQNRNQFNLDSTRQFGECYDLAFAQQLKNKDIAEGGSKAVCLIDVSDTMRGQDKDHLMRKSVKAFVNSLLDLITINDFNKVQELIYLGPDEQINVEHINWIVKRAAERNYIMPSAFMSSKPDQGINHKEFGVTSEGISVFLDVALKSLGMVDNGKDYFTVKITGGPDGDVGGNMLNILHRTYGDKCRIVGIADGTGCVEDEQNGIAWPELLRLFKEGKPLSEINPSALLPSTIIHSLDKAEGVRARNTLHNRIKSDAFIPAGGRPATINEKNWREFLCENGQPSSKLIVEGANLFLTNAARAKLAELGVVIIKDSSANKCGVICSSFEIMSCMLLNKEDFLAIKKVLVPEVLERLRHIARKEAELLMTEYRKNSSQDGKSTFNLVNISIEVSKMINRSKDIVREHLLKASAKNPEVIDKYMELIKEFLPASLVAKGFQNWRNQVPDKYTISLIATILSCELVYSEGVDFMRTIKDDSILVDLAERYTNEKRSIKLLTSKVASSQPLTKKESAIVAKLLELGGTRAAISSGGLGNL